jgi:hypothetical protein
MKYSCLPDHSSQGVITRVSTYLAVQIRRTTSVAQALRDRQHPLAHRQAGEDVIAQVRCGLGHSARVARGADAAAFAREGHQIVLTAVVATYPRKAVGKDAAFEVFAES